MFSLSLVLYLLLNGSCWSCPYLNHEDGRCLSKNVIYERRLQPAPSKCPPLNGSTLIPTKAGICSAYGSIKSDFAKIVAIDDLLAKSRIYGAALRVAFHDAAEGDVQIPSDKLGPDGCLSDSSDNGGLIELDTEVGSILEPIYVKVCDKISRADFWVLFAKLVVEAADPTGVAYIKYQYGRKDADQCNTGASGRLPFPQRGMEELKRVFVDQMGLTLDEAGISYFFACFFHLFFYCSMLFLAVALMGGHTLGHVQINRSGFGFEGDLSNGRRNAWDDTPATFDNHYFVNLKEEVRCLSHCFLRFSHCLLLSTTPFTFS